MFDSLFLPLIFDYLKGQDAYNLLLSCKDNYKCLPIFMERYPIHCSGCHKLGGFGG